MTSEDKWPKFHRNSQSAHGAIPLYFDSYLHSISKKLKTSGGLDDQYLCLIERDRLKYPNIPLAQEHEKGFAICVIVVGLFYGTVVVCVAVVIGHFVHHPGYEIRSHCTDVVCVYCDQSCDSFALGRNNFLAQIHEHIRYKQNLNAYKVGVEVVKAAMTNDQEKDDDQREYSLVVIDTVKGRQGSDPVYTAAYFLDKVAPSNRRFLKALEHQQS